PTAEWLAQQLVEAFPGGTAPRHLGRDNDRVYGQAFTNRVRAMGIRDRPISPRAPWENPYAERLTGALRRDALDHVLIFGERHLRGVLTCIRSITMRRARIWDWGRTRRYDEPSNDLGLSYPSQSCADCITATCGYDFREGQVTAPPSTPAKDLAAEARKQARRSRATSKPAKPERRER